MVTAAPFPEAGERAQNKHVQMRVSMFVWLARVVGGGGTREKKKLHICIYKGKREIINKNIFAVRVVSSTTHYYYYYYYYYY